MSRTKLTSTSINIGNDSGNVLFSLIQGEQKEYEVTLKYLTDLTGYTFEAVLMEGNNVENNDSIPTTVRNGGVNTQLTVRVPATGNKIYLQFPSGLIAMWGVKPTLNAKVYGFFELRVTEPMSSFPQTLKPLRGVVEFSYSPTDLVN